MVVPASSPAAVATTSFGSALAQADMVIGFSSGEEKTAARPTVRRQTTTSAMTNSLTRSYGPLGKSCESGVLAAAGSWSCQSPPAGVDRRHDTVAPDQDDVDDGQSDPTTSGSSTTCHISICPGLSTLNQAPTPTEFMPSLAWAPIHCASKLVWER